MITSWRYPASHNGCGTWKITFPKCGPLIFSKHVPQGSQRNKVKRDPHQIMGVIIVKCHHVNARANHFLKPKQTAMFRKQKNDKKFAHMIVWHRWISLFQVRALAWGPCFISFPKIKETIYEAEAITRSMKLQRNLHNNN